MSFLKHRLITVILILCAICIFVWSWNLQKYEAHHKISIPLVQGEQKFIQDVWLRVGPMNETWLVKKIDNSEKRVWVGVYTFTVPSLREALLRAKKRGVDVQIILEKFPFWNTNINRETEQFLQKNNISFHQSDASQFAFMHAKYMIFDDSWVIETSNWTRASFASNREFFIEGTDVDILSDLVQIFERDFAGERWQSHDVRLLAGPTNARERLQAFIDTAEKDISIYAPSFSDQALIKHLNQACLWGKNVRILLADYEEGWDKSDYGTCIQVKKMKKPLHAKVIIGDARQAFVWSFNYTKNSLEKNREIGLFMQGENMNTLIKIFESDWKTAVALH